MDEASAQTEEKTDAWVGQFCGNWKLTQLIGRGAYGAVYAATGPDGARAAVKVCRRTVIGAERAAREWRGARIYQKIAPSEGLVRLIDLAETDWGFYLVMELADDEFDTPVDATNDYRPKTLARVIASEKALPLESALKLAIALAKGLESLQRHHLLHRDVKPDNVIYVRGRPVLADIGLLVEERAAASRVGTPGYVPPESFTDPASDIYSLGLTLKAASFGRSIDELAHGPTLEADTTHPQFPAWWRILNKATHPDAARRYRSAKALLNDLQQLRRRTLLPRLTPFRLMLATVALVLLILYIIRAVHTHVVQTQVQRDINERLKQHQEMIQKHLKNIKIPAKP